MSQHPPGSMAETAAELASLADDLIDQGVADLRARVEAGYTLTREETLGVLDQLVKDRARKRLFHERLSAPLQ